jgi:3-isopropylmalate/(R)-2-methylmalate dehydratase small subunit
LIETDPTTAVTVDLEQRTITAADLSAPFQIDDYTRYRLLNGLDDVDITLTHADDIEAYEARRPSYKPATLPALHSLTIIHQKSGSWWTKSSTAGRVSDE